MNIIKKDATVERAYDMRAQPRRRPKEENEQPLFLKKAFTMIDKCPPHLGGWSEKGDTFIVKDVKNFSEQIIPTVFKHNNFSSFVRQLNFYGFRKIKSELYSQNAQYWEFRHPHFMKGQPELLSEIKRAVHYAPPQDQTTSVHEVDALKTQVAGISSRVSEIDDSIAGLSQLVSDLISQSNKRGQDGDNNVDDAAKKRRRLPSLLSFRLHNDVKENTLYSSGSEDNLDDLSEACSVSSEEHVSVEKGGLALPRGSELHEIELLNSDFFRMNSGDLMNDDLSIEFYDYLGLEPTAITEADAPRCNGKKDCYPSYSIPAPAALVAEACPSQPLISSVADIPDILKHLTAEMQERFIDRLAESVGANFAKLLAASTPSPAPTIPTAPAMSMSNYAGHFVQQIQRQPDLAPCWPNQQDSSSCSSTSANCQNGYGQITPAMALPLASAALCSLIAVHCRGNNVNSAACIAIQAASQAAGIAHNSGVCANYSQSANV